MADSIDLKARQVIMASWLYYEKNVSLISDAEFDSLCKVVAAELEWLDAMGECEIDPVRCVQLGSADELKVSGFHIRQTQLSIAGACSWYQSKRRRLGANAAPRAILPGEFKGELEPTTGVLMRSMMG
ncbi:hypothetical protein RDJLphi1_gp51 [Roseobacter phage RDJL Phi 1]|uniref:Uncharacterized protein n=1 Tax=Roseobacter phage RDJL Phi 1 TaxID=562742 RepID=F4YXR2_9CAUD|nr:hypothetical protein RDJLphi1_gp51 [Roseobacter phage RDJL Phi 1]ADK73452.1 hypothetical protein RDJLphi1_gp51 [Roseobacter phage RDJL Phi 1]